MAESLARTGVALVGQPGGAENELLNIHSAISTTVDRDVAALDTLYVSGLGINMATLAPGDYVGVLLQRSGGHGNDTFTGDIRVYGVRLRYDAEQ